MINQKNILQVIFGAFFALILVFIYFIAVPQAEALSISPLTFEINVDPGQVITNSVRVFNNSEDAITIRMSAEDFAPTGEEGNVVIAGEINETYALSKWITLEPASFTLGPGEDKVVNFTVNIPANGEPGGHYGSILAEVGGGLVPGSVAIAQKLGSLLLVQVSGEIQERLWIKSMDTIKKIDDDYIAPSNFFEYGPVTLSTRFENTGSVHLKPRGFILIKDMFGREVASITLEQLNVLPNSVRRIESEFDKRLLLGKYTATLTAIYGSKNEPLTYTTTFWGFPWKIGGAIALGALLLFIFLIRGRKRIRVALRVLLKGHHV